MVDSTFGACPYTSESLAQLEEQERVLRYAQGFGSAEALALGNAVAQLAPQYDRGVSVEVVRESDGLMLFAWSTDDKAPRNFGFAERKRSASQTCDHSSLWGYVRRSLDGVPSPQADDETGTLYAGGAFPIRDGAGRRVATIALSGLHEGKDHEIVVRALERALGRKAPAFTFSAV